SGIVGIFIDFIKIMVDAVKLANCQLDRIGDVPEKAEIKDPDDPGRGFVTYTREQIEKELKDNKQEAKEIIKDAKERVGEMLEAINWENIVENVTDSIDRTTTIVGKIIDIFDVESRILDRRSIGFTDENKPVKLLGDLTKKDIRQICFDSEGVECTVVADSELRKKFIPLNVSVIYDYEADSELSIDFISEKEWKRRVSADELVTGIVQSRMVTSPVKLSISTFDQPLREDQPFAVGFEIKSGEGKNSLVEDATIEILYPSEFSSTKCIGAGTFEYKGCEEGECKIVWEVSEADEEGKAIWCNFEDSDIQMGEAPTKTYIVKAHADYTFRRWKTKSTEIRFGGYCCSPDDCVEGKICKAGVCIRKEIEKLSGETESQARIRTAVSVLAARPATPLSEGTVVMSKMGPEGDGKVNISGKSYVYKDGVLTKGSIKEYLERFSGMLGAEEKFFDLVKEGVDIDPAFAIAVAMYGTEGGKSSTSVSCRNLFNLDYETSERYKPSGASVWECVEDEKIARFVSFDDSITTFYKVLTDNCKDYKNKTVEEIAESECLIKEISYEWRNAVARYRAGVHKVLIDKYKAYLESRS
ncbi:MAG: hypothetical protein JSV39_03445, partial [Candidatus Aenigmatarchaeota archaeon]